MSEPINRNGAIITALRRLDPMLPLGSDEAKLDKTDLANAARAEHAALLADVERWKKNYNDVADLAVRAEKLEDDLDRLRKREAEAAELIESVLDRERESLMQYRKWEITARAYLSARAPGDQR